MGTRTGAAMAIALVAFSLSDAARSEAPAEADAAAEAAADADADAEIIVTGRSIEETLPRELAKYGSDISVVSEAQVRASGAVDIANALRQVPGLYVQTTQGPFSYVEIALQGSRTADVLWTVDGIRINNRLYNGTSPNDTLPASMIERVEVLRGGESLFYGTQAAAGVINVVTRGFTDDFNGHVDLGVDSRDSTNIGGYVRGSIGAHKFVAFGSRNYSHGYRSYSDYQPSATDRRRGYRVWSLGGKYRYDLTSDLQLNAQYQHTIAKLDNITPTRIRESRNDRNEEIASVRLDYTGSDTVGFYLKGYFHDWKTAYVQILNPIPAGTPIVVYPPGTFWGFQDYGGSAVMKLNLHPGLEYLVGYDFQNFNGRDDVLLIGKLTEQVHAGIFQVRTTDDLSTKGRIAAGLRYNETGGSKKTIWNVSGRYDLTGSVYAEANGGTSFVLPDASSLYGIDPCCEIGNPNLKPEQSLNLNAGIGANVAIPGGRITAKASYFTRNISDLIDYDYDNPAFPNGVAVNVAGKVRARGYTAEAAAQLDGGFTLSASYTHSRVRNAGSSLQRDRVPLDVAQGSIAWAPTDLPFGANAQVRWVGDAFTTPSGFTRRNYGDYVTVDAGVFLFVDRARHHRLGVTVENLFDRDYATRGFQSSPRDTGGGRFLYFARGLPQTFRATYGLSF